MVKKNFGLKNVRQARPLATPLLKTSFTGYHLHTTTHLQATFIKPCNTKLMYNIIHYTQYIPNYGRETACNHDSEY